MVPCSFQFLVFIPPGKHVLPSFIGKTSKRSGGLLIVQGIRLTVAREAVFTSYTVGFLSLTAPSFRCIVTSFLSFLLFI